MEKVEVLTALQERELIECADSDGYEAFKDDREHGWEFCGRRDWKRRRNAVIVLLMCDAGLRVGEVVRLAYTDCYYCCKPVRKLKVRAEIAKGGVEREVPLTGHVQFALGRFWRGSETADGKPDHDFMITRSQFGERMTVRGVEKLLEKAGREKLGIKLYPHMLRHTCATKLMRITDMPTVQRILGHKHLSSTEIYTHPNSEDMDIAIKSMEAGCRPIREKPAGKSGGAMRLGQG